MQEQTSVWSGQAARIVFFASGTHFMVHLYENSFSGILKFLQKEWAADYTAIGTLGVPLFFLFGLMAIPGGWLADRQGSKRLLLICLFGAALASFAASMTRPVAGLHPMAVLSVLLALLGLFTGLYHPAGLSFISRGVKRKGRAMGLHGIMGNLGLATAPFLAAWLAGAFGWRAAFLVFSVPALVLGAGLLATPFRPQEGTRQVSGSLPLREFFPKQRRRGRIHPLMVLFSVSVFNGLAYRSVLVYLPSYFRDKVGDTSFLSFHGAVLAGLISTIILLVGTFGQWTGGYLADRGSPERKYCLMYFVAAPFLLGMGHLGGAMLILVSLVFAFSYFSLQPLKNTLLARYAHPQAQGMAYGVVFFLEFGLGSFGAALAGMVADHWGMIRIFDLAAVMMVVMGALAALLIKE